MVTESWLVLRRISENVIHTLVQVPRIKWYFFLDREIEILKTAEKRTWRGKELSALFILYSPCLRTLWRGARGGSRRTRRWTRSERRERRGRDRNIDNSSFRHSYPPTGSGGQISQHSCHKLSSGRLWEAGISCKWNKTSTWPTVPWPETEKLHLETIQKCKLAVPWGF